jgi:menaquinone-dependent protoporphyrinogen oxidase
MRVLVTAASKYGSTVQIAAAIADTLATRGLDVSQGPLDEVEGVDGFDAVILGSAVYAGRWMRPARALAARLASDGGPPTWLFSSGPIGDPPEPEGDPADVADWLEGPSIRGHRVFAGRLVRDQLHFGDRAIVSALRSPDGDFRDWTAINAWANAIADDLDDD